MSHRHHVLPGTDACISQEPDILVEMDMPEGPLEILYLLTSTSKLVYSYMPIDKARIAAKYKFKDLPGQLQLKRGRPI